MSLTYAQIRAFNAVVREGSFTAAAKRLGVSQPAITAQIKGLEDSYGVSLFERTGQKIVLTELARLFFQTTQQIQDVEAEAEEILLSFGRLDRGEIRIVTGSPLPAMTLVAAFRQRYPHIEISVSFRNWQQGMQALWDREADVAILTKAPSNEDYVGLPFYTHRIAALVPSTYELAASPRCSLLEVSRHPVIFRTSQSLTQKTVDNKLQEIGLTIEPSLTLDTREAVYEAVRAGIGIGFMFEGASSRHDDVSRLIVDELSESFTEDVFCLKSQYRRRVIAAFMSLADEMKPAR